MDDTTYEKLIDLPIIGRSLAFEDMNTAAGTDAMKENLEGVAGQVSNLLASMDGQLQKEDEERQIIIVFFLLFTLLITVMPIIVIGILFFRVGGRLNLGESIAALAAFVNIPVSTISVLKSISTSLFNDTYRKTMPEMIVKITDALAKYHVSIKMKSDV